MGTRTSMAIALSLAALMAMAPEPLWASEHAGASGSTDVIIQSAIADDSTDTGDKTNEDDVRPLDQTGTSHLPTILIAGGFLCGGAAIILRKRGSDRAQGDEKR